MLPPGLPWEKINHLVARAEVIDQKLAATSDGATLVQLSKERAELQDIAEAVYRIKAALSERDALDDLAGDPEMAALFLASGPDIHVPASLLPSGFDNVDVYPLLARLIGVAPLPGDGNPATLDGLLARP